ncbi:hypothetical protein PLICRDRAFT_86494 [Plicaturopsis crispa FD-325 SS-3]|nr:hypothetical protein PLICRDRAFT_86494 [Plicaturopsis crispa FD-325 SS-3]
MSDSEFSDDISVQSLSRSGELAYYAMPESELQGRDIELFQRTAPCLPQASDAHVENAPDGAASESKARHRLDQIQFLALLFDYFIVGWNDGSAGPLIPRIQSVYNISYMIVSMVFIANCVGYVAGSVLNIKLTDKLGFGKVITLGCLIQSLGYCIQATAPPFPVFALSYLATGFGLALQQAQNNGYVSSTRKSERMSILHAVYGAGALASPLVATQFAQLRHWSFHYLVSLGISLLNLVVLICVFRLKTMDECLAQIGLPPGEVSAGGDSKYRQIFTLKALHILAFFILVYDGIEVTIGGWIVSYITEVRHGGASSGYISSGYFGGLMIGRLALLWVSKKIGERRALLLYVVLAIGLELVVWFVPSLIGGAVAVSLVGLVFGPVYPITMNEARRILPNWVLTESIGWISGFGATGGALFPFIAGVIASKDGVKTLQPLLVSMMGTMFVLWTVVPKSRARGD